MGVKERYEQRQKSGRKASYSGVRQRSIAKEIKGIASSISQRTETWLKNHNNYLSNYNGRFSKRKGTYEDAYVADAGDWLSIVTAQKENFDKEASNILSMLDRYGDYLDADWSKSIRKALTDAGAQQADVLKYASSDSEYWAQFADQWEYGDWQRYEGYKSKYSGKTYEDLQAALEAMEDGEERQWLSLYQLGTSSAGTYETLDAEDLDQYSGYASTKQKGLLKSEYADTTYEIVNRNKDAWNQVTIGKVYGKYSDRQVDDLRSYEHMTDDEVKVYNYHYAKGGWREGQAYLDSIKGILEARKNHETMAQTQEFAEDHPWTASGMSVVTSLASGFEYLNEMVYNGLDAKAGKEVTLDTNLSAAQTNIIRGTVSEKVAWEIGHWDAGAFLYNTAMSGADSLAAGLTFGNWGGAVLGLSAAAQGTNDALDRGMSDGQAFFNGLVSGVFEGLFESVSIGNLNKLKEVAPESVKHIIKNLGKSMLVNASEETLTELANLTYDTLINGEFANYTWEELKNGAWKDALAQVIEAGASGALMGVGMGTVGNAIGYGKGSSEAKKTYGEHAGALVGKALEIDPDNTFAQKMQGKLDSGKSLSGGQLNKLVQQNERAMVAQDMQAIQNAAAQRLAELGESGDVNTTAQALAKQAAGKKLTRAEKQAISGSRYGSRVANELDTANIKSGDYSSGWAESIGTNRINAQEYGRMLEAAQTAQEGAETTGEQVAAEVQNEAQRGEMAVSEKEMTTQDTEHTGVTMQVSTGKEVTPKKIASISDGKVMIQTDNGTVAADDIEFGDNDTDLLWRSAVTFNGITAAGANGIIHTYRSGQPMATYLRGAAQEFRNGYNNLPSGGEAADKLTPGQRAIIYELGQKAAGEKIAGEQAAKKAATKKTSATVSQKERVGMVHFDRKGRRFDKTREASLAVMEQLSKLLGVDFYVFESYRDTTGQLVYKDANGNEVSAPNGFYDPQDGSVHIDLNAGADGKGTMLFTIAHELTHFIKDWSPAKFKVLANFLVTQYGQKGVSVNELVEAQIAKADRNGRELSWEDAFEEVVADSMEAMLVSGNVVEMMAQLQQRDKSLWQKIREWFKDLAAQMKAVVDAYKGYQPDSNEGRMVAQMEDVIVILESFYADALLDAGDNYQAGKAEKNTTPEGGVDSKYSIREGMSEQERYESLKNKRVVVMSDSRTADYSEEIASLEVLKAKAKSKAEKIIKPLAKKLGIINTPLSTADVETEFLFTASGGLAESMHKQLRYGGSYVDFAKTLINLDHVLETAVLIEAHGDKYAQTTRADEHLEAVYVLFGAFRDGDNIIPVQMEIKKSSDVGGRLYLTVAMTKIEAGVLGSAPGNIQAPSLIPASEYSLAEIFSKINPQDKHFLKYLPDGFLSSEQIEAKGAAVAEDASRIMGYRTDQKKLSDRNSRYMESVNRGDMETAQKMVDQAAKAAGYAIKAYHGTDAESFHVYDKGRIGSASGVSILGDGFYFAEKKKVAAQYGKHVHAVYLKQGNPYAATSDDAYKLNTAKLEADGYDGVKMPVKDGSIYMVLDPEQIKSADPVTYDDQGNVIPLSERFKPTSNDIRYSDRDNADIYSRVFDMQQEVGRLQRAIEEFERSAEFKAAGDKLSEAIRNDNIAEGIREYQQWRENSGYASLIDQRDALRVELEKLTKERDALAADEGAEAEKTAIVKSGLSEGDYFRKLAVKEFGYTPYFYDAGYITPNGKMLNFSGEKGQHFGSRGEDHRAIGIIYEGTRGSEAMVRFMNDGNIRIMAETPGLDISSTVEPTKEQYATIKKFAREYGSKEQYFAVDISDENGRVVGNYEYNGYVNADRVVNDIKYFYANGSVREQSSIANFLQSERDPELEKVNRVLERENGKLREDVAQLRELLKLQRTVTGGTKFTRSSVEAAAGQLMKYADAKGDRKELAGLLNSLYEHIAGGEELTWESVKAAAQPAVDWLQSHVRTKQQRSEYAEGNAYGYDQVLFEQDLLRQVYDSYWNVSTLYTVADKAQKEITRLKLEHTGRMKDLRQYHAEKIAKLKAEHRQALQKVKQADRERMEKALQETRERYQQSRERNTENRRKAEMRRKIRRTIMDLGKLLNKGDKKRNVKEDMKDLVAQALKSADILFMDNYSNEDMVRDGVGTELTEQEAKYMAEAKALMEQIGNLPSGSYEAFQVRQEQESKLKGQLSYRMGKLQDVFDRERARLNKTKVSEVLGSLADAYASLQESENSYVSEAYQENVYQYLLMLKTDVGGTGVKDMSIHQLEELHKAYTMVLTAVRNANRMFAENLKKTREELGKQTITEVKLAGGNHGLWLPGEDKLNAFSWNNQKPVYAFERIGSETLKTLFENIRAGEDGWAVDMANARSYYLEQAKKHGYDSWDMGNQYHFTSSSGVDFSLNLEQIMSLYAYSKREQAHNHLLKGGFVFDGNTEVQVNKHGIKVTYLNKTAKAYNVSMEILADIVSTLTAEQKAFVDAMQDYLSTTMGGKGNEVSMRLYGVKLFNEQYYFPLRSAGQYMERAKEADLKKQQGQISIVNSGFAKATTPKSSNPVVLSGFMDVWADHVNEMSMYHSFVLPMEDFRRVYNYATPNTETGQSVSVNSAIQDAYGEAATGYIDQLYRDLNGGAVSDPRETPAKAMMGKFKKAAVFASLSVVVQQPSAVGRAFAIIDPKYFIGAKVDSKRHKALWEQLKQYAPVAAIKEMGYFDTGMGKSAQDYLKGKEYGNLKEKAAALVTDENYRDEMLGKLPALADELTWCAIWEAVKRETKASNPKMDVTSEDFLQMAGKRFTEVITKTQVYDSVLSRSANMRSKGALMSMWTAFMAEPTTTINMVEDALRKGKQGDKRYAARAMGAVVSSIFLNSVLSALVYAMRDDDEDETFFEKYAQSFATEMLDGLNPITYYPFLKDVWSALQGFDIERADMSLITKAIEALTKLVQVYAKDADSRKEGELAAAWWGVADYVTAFTGIPVKNVRRDINGAINTVKTIAKDWAERDTSLGSLLDKTWDSVKNAIPVVGWLPDETAADKLYDATVSGDAAYRKRLESAYDSQSKLDNAIRKGLRSNDARIWEAAMAWNSNDLETYKRIAKEIVGEGHFSQDNVVMAIQAEAKAMLDTSAGSSESKAKGYFTAEKFAVAIAQDNDAMAQVIQADMVDTAQANGKTPEEAQKSFASSAKRALKELFIEGGVSAAQAVDAMTGYCEMDEDDALDAVLYWDFLREHPAYEDLSQAAVVDYYEWAEPAGIDTAVYYDYYQQASQCESDLDKNGNAISGSKKAKILAVIDAMDLTKAQKDALYYANGWAKSTLHEAPWR